MGLKQRGIRLVESDHFDFTVDDGVIVFKGDLSANESLVQQKLLANERFKGLDSDLQCMILDIILKSLHRTTEFGKKNDKLFTKLGYMCDRQISWNQFIPIQQVQLGGEFHNVDKKALQKLGYGVSRFSVSNYRVLSGNVLCVGKHPNISSAGTLCTMNLPGGEPLSVESLEKIRVMLSVANLDQCYRADEAEEIKSYIR